MNPVVKSVLFWTAVISSIDLLVKNYFEVGDLSTIRGPRALFFSPCLCFVICHLTMVGYNSLR